MMMMNVQYIRSRSIQNVYKKYKGAHFTTNAGVLCFVVYYVTVW